MTDTVLVIDDDFGIRETMTAVLRDAGYRVVAVGTGEAGVEAFTEEMRTENALAAIFIDLLLPKMSGFDCARQLKSQGCTSPLVLMSGVFKSAQHKDDAERLGARFLQKPFAHETLVKMLRQSAASGSAARPVVRYPMPEEGTLLDSPALHLLWRAAREGHSGILDFFGEASVRARVFVYKGRATMAQHSDTTDNVGIELVRRGQLSAEMYVQAAQWAVERRQGLHEVIKAEGWADELVFREAYRAILPGIIGKVAVLSGRFRWTASTAFSSLVPTAPVDLLPALHAGVRAASLRELAPHIEPRGPLRLSPGENWEFVEEDLERACGSSSLMRAINGRATIAQLISVARHEDDKVQRMRQIYLLLSTQSVQASVDMPRASATHAAAPSETPQPRASRPAPPQAESMVAAGQVVVEPLAPPFATAEPAAAPAPGPSGSGLEGLFDFAPQAEADTPPQATPAPAPAAPPPTARATGETPAAAASVLAKGSGDVDDSGVTFRPEDEEARQRIFQMHTEIAGKKHWEVLGLSHEQSKDAGALKRAYFTLARDWHTDRFAGHQLGSAQRKLDHIFSAVSDAYNILSNQGKREEYEAKVFAEEAGISQDLGALLEAEQDFSKGMILLERGEILAADKLFDKALSVNSSNREWAAYRSYTSWWQHRDIAQAEAVIGSLDKTHKDMPGVVDLLYFQGRIYLEVGNTAKADRLFRKCLDERPDHAMCLRDRRALQRKLEEEEKKSKGGLGRFLKR